MSTKFSPGATITSNWLNQVDDLLTSSGGGAVTSFNTRQGAVTLNSGDVTSALGFTPQTSGSYAPATSGTSLLYGNGSGGFSNVTIGSGITFSGGTLSASGGGSGTVTSVSGVSANGFNISVNTPTTTPSIVISTAITGLLKGNGTVVSAATAGTDYAAAPTGTAAQLLANNGSGGFSNVTVGSGLTLSAGTLSAPGGSGAWTKLQTQTASSSATLDFTGLSGYSRYAIMLEDVVAASATQVLAVRLGTGGSPTWLTSAYIWQIVSASGSTSSAVQATSGAYFNIGGYNGGVPVSSPGCSGLVLIFGALTNNPSITADTTSVSVSSPSIERTSGGGAISAGAVITAMRLLMSSGNIASGTATLYGIN